MIAFQVNDMTCSHCVGVITKAVKAADQDARVTADLSTRRVEVESSTARADKLKTAIQQAGYTPIEASVSQASATPGSSCCGSCH